jgi:cell division topological specificity factor
MNLLDLFRKQPPSAPAARERLQILMAHERVGAKGPDFLPKLHKDLLRVCKKYMQISDDKVSVRVEELGNISMLEVNIELPGGGAYAR